MKRKITEQLVAWKNRPGHKPLILQGARQVGKSYILEKFGKEHYKNYVRVSLDLVPDVRSFLKANINPLEVKSDFPMKFGSPGTDLVKFI